MVKMYGYAYNFGSPGVYDVWVRQFMNNNPNWPKLTDINDT